MASNNSTALVTGAAGFLGNHTIRTLLDRGWSVRALDRPDVDLAGGLCVDFPSTPIQIDSRDILDVPPEDELFTGVNAIFHCAGIADHRPSFEHPERYIRANVLSLVRVLDAARLHDVEKVIHPSSAAVYGRADWPTSEDHPIAPINPYGLSKRLAEQTAQEWFRLYGVATISFRIFNGYGPNTDERHGLVGAFLQRKLSGRPITIAGTGSQRRDFIYVSDIVDAFICAAESDIAGEIYNLGSGVSETILSLAKMMDTEIEFVTAQSDELPVTCADISRIRDHLAWSPKVSLEDGIGRVMQAISETAV